MLRRIRILIRWRLTHLGSEDKAGIYLTVIAHLAVIIVLLAVQVHTAIRRSDTFLLDFSAQEAQEKNIEETEFKESISKRLEEMLGDVPLQQNRAAGEPVRNIAVDASGHLKDDRNTDASDLYADAERLARELKEGQKQAITEDARDEAVEIGKENKKDSDATSSEKEYSGPSVLSYTLDGRKASHLRIPAYRCYGGGEVTVIIVVDPSGRVLNAKVMDEVSSTDQCLRDFAIRAARLSRFSASRTAPARQTGEIVYRFIAQ